MQHYYDQIWTQKLSLPQYASLEKRWRSRWEFALNEIETGSSVLDVGCGDGVFGELAIQRKKCHVTGLDISRVALDHATRRGVVIHQCDISEDPFPVNPDHFDVVSMLCCLEHIIDPAHALCEAARAVRPRGKVLVTLPNAVQFRFRWAFLRGRLSADFLHTNVGEGFHAHFFNYNNDFDRFASQMAPQLLLVKKIPTLKNPNKYGPLARRLYQVGMWAWPNLFAEYGNFVLVKRDSPN